MSNWSIYVSPEEEKLLKKKIQSVANKNRWSFSQAITGILKEHLIEENSQVSAQDEWNILSAHTFFDGYSDKDSIYDTL